ncbi:MAG: LacI family DNA-binding transcriptional regulator [Rikenellaceae bacterium]
MKRVTIKDIAEHLTISVSTVSRALTDDKNIRQETKDRVVEAAEKLGYRPNPVATNLKYGRTNTVGVIVPEMITPFAAQVIGGIQEVLFEQGIKVVIAESEESWEIERENIKTMERFMVDGVIASICDYKRNREAYLELEKSGMAVVFFDRIPHQMEVSQVVVDDYIKSFFLTEHLIRSGRKRIVHLHGPDHIYNSTQRAKGYRDALKKFDIAVESSLVVHSNGMSFEDGAEAAEMLLNLGVGFDAIFAFTDTLGIGAMNYLRDNGVMIPSEVAVASFSGTVLSTVVHPQLTTIEPPLAKIGREAAHLVVEKIKRPDSPTRYVVMDASIELRASTEGDIISTRLGNL